MNVDEPRRHGEAARVDLDGPSIGDSTTHRRDPPAGHADVHLSCRRACPIDDVPTANDEIVLWTACAEDRGGGNDASNGGGGARQEIATRGQRKLAARVSPNVTAARLAASVLACIDTVQKERTPMALRVLLRRAHARSSSASCLTRRRRGSTGCTDTR